MQFLPVDNQIDVLSSLSRERSADTGGGPGECGFAGIMEVAQDLSVRSGSYDFSDARQAASSTRKVLSDVERGVDRTGKKDNAEFKNGDFLDETVTQEDFAALKDALHEQGLSKDKIDELEESIEKGELSWKQLLSKIESFGDGSGKIELAAGDAERIQSFLRELGFTADQSKKMLDDLLSGDLDKIFAQIADKLQNMPQDKLVSVSEKDFQSLIRAFGLKDSEFEFPYGKESKLNKEQLRHILTSLKQEAFKSSESSFLKDLQDLKQGKITAGEMLDKLANSEGKDKNSALVLALKMAMKAKRNGEDFENIEDKKRYYKAMADREKDQNSNSVVKEGKNNSEKNSNARSGASEQKFASDSEHASKQSKSEKFLQNENEGKNGQEKSQTNIQAGKDASAKTSAANQNSANSKQDNESRENAKSWKDFLSKLNSSDDSNGNEKKTSKQAFFQSTNLNDLIESRQIKNPSTGKRVPASRVMDQIQQGMFKNMGQGRSQMTLQLTPPQLGAVSLVLHVKHNEVQAMIRTTSHEVTNIVQENMNQLKANLEQQGLKVSRMEVQTQLQEDSHLRDGSWQGTEQHNEAREKLRKGGRMGMLRNMEEDGEDMVRELHMIKYGENISQSGLDMFA